MTTLPTASDITDIPNVAGGKTVFGNIASAVAEMPGGAVATTMTIGSGQITPTVACHLVDTEGAAASDDLTNIVTTNHPDGRRLLISMVDAARVVTVKHNAGGAGQIALANGYDLVLKVGGWIELKRTGANWEEVGRSQNLVTTMQLSGPVNEAYATVASAATTANIWSAKGNVINFTGTATVTAFPAAPQAGVRRRLICAGACSFTAGANLVIDGVTSGSTLTVAAGDVIDIESVSTTSFKLHYVPVGGYQPKNQELTAIASLVSSANKIPMFTGSGVASLINLDTDNALAANSDTSIATQKAVKTYVDSRSSTDQTARDQLALTDKRLMISTEISSGALYQGYQWELTTDEWATGSSGYTFTSASPNYYTNAAEYMVDLTAPGGTAASSSNYQGYTAGKAVDNSLTTTNAWMTNGSTTGWWSYDFGEGVTKVITQYKITCVSSDSSTAITNTRSPKNWTFEGSNDGSTWTTVNTQTNISFAANGAGETKTFQFSNSTAYRYYRVNISANNGDGNYAGFTEIEMMESASPTNMTLVSPAVSVSSDPSAMDAHFLWKDDSGSAVLGTDLTVELSRDGGTTWTAATLTTLATYDDTYSIIKTRADVSGQPSGTSVKARIKTLNKKVQRIAAPDLYKE